MTTTWQPTAVIRRSIEAHVLDLYDAGGNLRPEADWPGVYTLPNGTRIPAVFVIGQRMVPSKWKIEGIETTINDLPTYRSSGGATSVEEWTVQFVNYGNRSGTEMAQSLRAISQKLARAFPQDRTSSQPRTEATHEAITAYIRGTFVNPLIP